jgi:hypothetical protein
MAIIEAMETSDAREEGGSANDDDDDADDEDDTRIRFAGWSSIAFGVLSPLLGREMDQQDI